MVKVERWKNAAYYNLPIHRSIMMREGGWLSALLHPIVHRNRVNMWVLAAGILDAARYMNLGRMHIAEDLHEGYDGNATERGIWGELRMFLEFEHADCFENFLDTYSASTDNFADTLGIKTALHDVVFNQPIFSGVKDPVTLLHTACHQHRTAQAKQKQEKRAVTA